MGEYIEIKNNIISDKEIDKTVFNGIYDTNSNKNKYIRMKIISNYTIGVSVPENTNDNASLKICNMSDINNPQPDEYKIYTINPIIPREQQDGGSLFHIKTHKRKPHRYTYKK
jgi:hypothetical protein